ncbi:hypothetical protein J7T55_012673 [Diaporthe amygdali]|uniref:uncharacterized protein n=1 Tax=Phomopsis amygdali TaxID=1214568 RepID=UPI0022FDC289|nr:uncharacterized protein J7T55_012673 [Diaporthe amygdali]KAJ0115394.1 hypothetical protein J7T55_012673 [Diaporthe amygdali]
MSGGNQPYMYDKFDRFDDDRFPTSSFDPKAVTRASWEPKPVKSKHEGPLVSFNRHPDAHEIRGPRSPFRTFGPATKWWIKWMRILQLAFRVLEMIAAAGILFFMIVITEVSPLTAWVMRITAGAVLIHCVYGIFHLARPAGARPPGSSAGYQIFSAISDLTALPLYAFGALSVHNSSTEWATLLNPQTLMDYFLPSLYYTLVGGGALHFLSLCISLWLALKFRQIVRMPPDCNPLEDNLTSRQHKRNKSSMATATTFVTENEKRLSTPLDGRRYSGIPDDDLSRPPSIPFHATRSSPRSSFGSADFPARQYQITPGNSPKNSPRNSATAEDFKRMSGVPSSPHSSKPAPPPHRSPWRGSYSSYAEVPTRDIVPDSPRSYGHQSRPSTGTVASHHPTITNAPDTAPLPRPARFTESWLPTDSLINRTQERNRAINAAERAAEKRKTVLGYESLSHPYYDTRDSDSESDYENDRTGGGRGYRGLMSPGADEFDENDGDLGSGHPNPLRSNPSLANVAQFAGKQGRNPNSTPIIRKSSALSEIDLNDRRVSGSNNNRQAGKTAGDITDEKPSRSYGGLKASLSKRYTWAGARNRNSSIQPESDFYSKPYGELKSATPPVIIGSDRQVSSGNDLDLSGAGGGEAAQRYFSFGKRNVSGKVAEEGRGIGWAR